MRVLHVIPSLGEQRGGPSAAALAMVAALNATGAVQAEIVSSNDNRVGTLDVDCNNLTEYREVPVWFFARYASMFSPIREYQIGIGARAWLRENMPSYDVVHVHAIFSYMSTVGMSLARELSVPYVVRPIGQLGQWSLRQSPIRKWLYWNLLERRNLQAANAVHFTSALEHAEALATIPDTRASIIPPGVSGSSPVAGASEQLRRQYNLPRDALVALYLSRLHPKKGIEYLLRAVAAHANVHLLVAGSGDPAYEQVVHELIDKLGINARVSMLGFVAGKQKDLLLQGADLFALTSYSENFGIAVAEALVNGTPALVTDGVALAEFVTEHQAGRVCALNDRSISEALGAFARSRADEAERGRIRALASAEFQWSAIAGKLAELYRALATT